MPSKTERGYPRSEDYQGPPTTANTCACRFKAGELQFSCAFHLALEEDLKEARAKIALLEKTQDHTLADLHYCGNPHYTLGCDECGESINPGQRYYATSEGYAHASCLDDEWTTEEEREEGTAVAGREE